MKEKDKLIYLKSLGCNKNTVDSEIILSLLKKEGYKITQNPEEASSIIVNTCAFIDDAKEEAIDTILELSNIRMADAKLIVAGCFSQLYSVEILQEISEVDAVTGIGNLEGVLDAVRNSSTEKDFPESRKISDTYKEYVLRNKLLTLPGYAYLKIAEGCSRNCSFCLVPKIKGKIRSRALNKILEEAQVLEKKGIYELILTSQDTLNYGRDLDLQNGLKTLIDCLLNNTDSSFFRLLYLRPGYELLENLDIFENSRVLPYFDIPIQHVSKKILLSMNRSGDYTFYKQIINKIRDKVPEAILRTTVIVGYPGETEEDFDTLLHFVEEMQFNHLGVFIFSPQSGTEAFKLKQGVAKKISERRKNILLETQLEISRRYMEGNIGKVFEVLIEEKFQNIDLYIGRSYHFAPEVDGVFLVRSKKVLKPGSMIKAKVTSADDYDLHGVAQ